MHKEVLKLLQMRENAILILSFLQLPFCRLLLALFQIASFPYFYSVNQLYQWKTTTVTDITNVKKHSKHKDQFPLVWFILQDSLSFEICGFEGNKK